MTIDKAKGKAKACPKCNGSGRIIIGSGSFSTGVECDSCIGHGEIPEPIVKENEILRKGIIAVRDLIEESNGVDGLHLNGDIAEWSTLLRGGFYEDWLKDFDDACNIL